VSKCQSMYRNFSKRYANELRFARRLIRQTHFFFYLELPQGNSCETKSLASPSIFTRKIKIYRDRSDRSFLLHFNNQSMRVFSSLLYVFLLSVQIDAQVEPAGNALEIGPDGVNPKQAAVIHEYVKIFPNQTQLSVALIDKGNLHFFGVKRENDSLFLIENRNKVFEIGSISKVMTVSLMTGLVLEGALALDDPIGKHMGLELKDGADITLAHLANHTSGLPGLPPNLLLASPEPLNPYKNYDTEKLETYWTDLAALQREPGEGYEYSNLGSGTLGYILTKATGRSYEELLRERI